MHRLRNRLFVAARFKRHSWPTDFLSVAYPEHAHGWQPCLCHLSNFRTEPSGSWITNSRIQKLSRWTQVRCNSFIAERFRTPPPLKSTSEKD